MLPFRATILLCASLLLLHALSQQQGLSPAEVLRRYRSADSLYRSALELGTREPYDEAAEQEANRRALLQFTAFLEVLPRNPAYDSLRFHALFKKGELSHYFEDLPAALSQYNEALAVHRNTPRLSDTLRFLPLIYRGIIHYGQSRFDTAFGSFREAEQLLEAHGKKLDQSERLYNNLGALYYERGNFYQARNYFGKAADVLPPDHPSYKDLLVNYRINQASAHAKLEEYEAALRIYREVLPFGLHASEIHQNIGRIYLAQGKGALALSWLRKVRYENGKSVRLYHDLARTFLQLQQYDSATAALQQADQEQETWFGKEPNPRYGEVLKTRGDLFLLRENAAAALHCYQGALHQLYPSFGDKKFSENPTQFSGIFSFIPLFEALVAKAGALRRFNEEESRTATLKWELGTYSAAFDLMDYVTRNYDSDEARLFLHSARAALKGRPLSLALQLFARTGEAQYRETAYLFDQKNKAVVLAYHRQSGEHGLSEVERKLRAEITRLSIRHGARTDTLGSSRDQARVRDLQMELGKIAEKKGGKQKGLVIPTSATLRKEFLDGRTALLSFHLTDRELITFILTQDQFHTVQQSLPAHFGATLDTVLQEIRQGGPARTPGPLQAVFRELEGTGIDRLLVIPDGALSYLPFEALEDGNGGLLLRKYAIQYQYATSLLQEGKGVGKGNVIGYAPFARNGYRDASLQLEALPHSEGEVRSAGGVAVIGTAATKEHFIHSLGRYPVLHLASHAVAQSGPENASWIAFAPAGGNKTGALLYSGEIAALPLQQTDLVILSACETGSGRLVTGEGVLSLSRAFAAAGCPNVITSLWKADDASTAYLTGKVHRYLKEGMRLDEAVRSAKLDYLEDKKISPRRKAPAYWAHLVFIGEYEPERTTIPYLWLFLLLPLAGLWWWYKRKQRQNTSISFSN